MVEGVQASTEGMESAEYRAEEKVARPSVLALIGGKLMVANVMVLLSSICSVLPFILIVEAFRRLLERSAEGVAASYVGVGCLRGESDPILRCTVLDSLGRCRQSARHEATHFQQASIGSLGMVQRATVRRCKKAPPG